MRKTGEKNLLSSYHESWKQFSRGIDYLHKLYLYLNTQHIKKQKVRKDLNIQLIKKQKLR